MKIIGKLQIAFIATLFSIASFSQSAKIVSNETEAPACTSPTAALTLFCDGSTTSSATFDFNNAGQTQFQYSYTINGGAPITGSFSAPSNFTVNGLGPGQEVAFTLTWVGLCGTNVKTVTCNSLCAAQVTPNFPAITPFCSGSTAPILPATSPNGISGTWSPATISNTTSGNYTFNPTTNCATSQTLSVSILPKVTPTFTSFASVCQNAPAPVLPQSSTNVPPITGTWSPAVSTNTLGTKSYTFTPSPNQCASATPVVMQLTVVAGNSPGFAAIPSFCSGTTPPLLLNISPTGVTGTWSPATINNTIPASYIFTPSANQCAAPQTLTTTITPRPTPTFAQIAPFCTGSIAPILPTHSLENFSGSWTPATISNTQSATYYFTPDIDCAQIASMQITVELPTDPDFTDIAFCSGTSAPILPSVSPNGIHGTWMPATIDASAAGSYTFTPNEGECGNQQTIQTIIHEPVLTNIDYVVTNAFEENQTITVTTTVPGNYLYQLDFGSMHTDNVFTHVSPGLHVITVYDANGCASALVIDNVLIVNYPHYFTPNQDGIHDVWKIENISPDSKVFIFDRFGRLLAKLGSEGAGWDGTYMGHPMPSSDYWFRIQYSENNVLKQFSSHFTLKR